MKDFLLEEEEVPEETEGEPRVLPELVVAEEESDISRRGKLGHPWIKRHATALFASISIFFLILTVIFISRIPERAPAVAEGEKAELMITTDPSEARIYLDAKLVGTGSPITLHDISAGEPHEISVDANGFAPQTQKIELKGSEFRSLEIVLTKAVRSKAVLIVASAPPGATLYIDDMETQHRTPATITDIEIGKRHTLGLFLPGHRYWKKDFEAHEGETLNFDVTLTKDVGALAVDSVPNGALVLLNDIPSGQTPFLLDNIEPDKIYRVEVWLEGYEPQTRDVKIDAGKKEELHLTLKKSAAVPVMPQEQPAPPAPPPQQPQPPAQELPVLPPANP
jgi:hypothetical protein